MAELWPDPVPGAPYTSCSQAALALGAAARRVSDFARSMVPTGPNHHPDEPTRAGFGGIVLADALRLAELAAEVVDAAVVLEREDGTDRAEITDRRRPGAPRARLRPAAAAVRASALGRSAAAMASRSGVRHAARGGRAR